MHLEGRRGLLTAAHVVGSLSEAAEGTGRVLYVASFGASSSADRVIGEVVLSHPDRYDVTEVGLDAALVEPADWVACSNIPRETITSCIARDVEASAEADNPVIVHKRGFKTDQTTGMLVPAPESLEVEGKLPDGTIVLRNYLRGYFVFGDEVPFAKDGDSGSIVVDDDDCVVGMVVAVRPARRGQITAADPAFVVPIHDIIERLDLELLGPSRSCTVVT